MQNNLPLLFLKRRWRKRRRGRKKKVRNMPKPLCISIYTHIIGGFPGGSEDKASACNAGDPGSIPGLGRSPGEGNGNPLQYSCLENPMDRGAWRATVYRVAKSRTRLSDFTHTHTFPNSGLFIGYLFYLDILLPSSLIDFLPSYSSHQRKLGISSN